MKRLHKKITALSLSLSLCAAVLAGCGAPKQVSTKTQAEVSTQAPAPAETQEAAQIETTQEILAEVEETAGKMPEGEIYIEPVEGISDDFIRGMDASSVLVEENSGVKYYNFDGEEQDVFQTLAEGGINYIRLRVWNDPFDENGNGYGGGNNDVATAVALGKRATAYGMKVCIDFHYSDFWADPKRQHAPKAWEGMDVTQKCDALYNFTKESLTEILDAASMWVWCRSAMRLTMACPVRQNWKMSHSFYMRAAAASVKSQKNIRRIFRLRFITRGLRTKHRWTVW